MCVWDCEIGSSYPLARMHVNFFEMCQGLADENMTEEQLKFRWLTLLPFEMQQRRDPACERPVTYFEMCRGLNDDRLNDEELRNRWNNLVTQQPALISGHF